MLSKHHSFTVSFFFSLSFGRGFTEFSKLRALSDTVSCFSSLCFCLAHSLDSILKPRGCGAGLSGMGRHMRFSIISRFSLFCLFVYIRPMFPAVFLSCICLAAECERPQTRTSLIFIVGCTVLGGIVDNDLCISDLYICKTLVPSFKKCLPKTTSSFLKSLHSAVCLHFYQ